MNNIVNPPAMMVTVNALDELAERINAEHHQAENALRAGLQHAKNAGDLLIEAKKQCKHGDWLLWLKKHVRFSERVAQGYMRVSRKWGELEAKAKRVSDLPYRDALALLADEPSAPNSTVAIPAAPISTVEELRRELWVRQWKEAGVKIPATTAKEYRESFHGKCRFLSDTGDMFPEDDPIWESLLYEKLSEIGAAYMIRYGADSPLPFPGDLSPDGKGWKGERNRSGCWDIYTAREAGSFLNWCDKVGLLQHLKGKVSLRLQENPYANMNEAAGAKEALRSELEGYEEKPFTDNDACKIFGVSQEALPETLYDYVLGSVCCFFLPIEPDAADKEAS
jgi:hypothetical protein